MLRDRAESRYLIQQGDQPLDVGRRRRGSERN